MELERISTPALQNTFKLGSVFEPYLRSEFAKMGIMVNGSADYDIRILNPAAYTAIALQGSLGLGESYMRGEWSCRRLDLFVEKIFRSDRSRRYTMERFVRFLKASLFNLQSQGRAKIVCESHYDLGNDLYLKMLDRRMVYTCAYWRNANSLEEAQEAKLDLICRKLGLKPGMKVLDIGCGFGSFMKFAAENYGVEAVGYSLSKEQIRYGEADCKGLPIQFVFDDYRNITGTYDRVVSIGMLEAVGYKNLRNYMKVVHGALKNDGVALIHTVGHNYTTYMADPWVDTHIFPNGLLPSLAQIGEAIDGLLVMEDLHNFGPDYHKTLIAWHDNFQDAWPELKEKYSETFKRMWEFYLLSFAGGFKARNWQLWQMVLTKKGRAREEYFRQT